MVSCVCRTHGSQQVQVVAVPTFSKPNHPCHLLHLVEPLRGVSHFRRVRHKGNNKHFTCESARLCCCCVTKSRLVCFVAVKVKHVIAQCAGGFCSWTLSCVVPVLLAKGNLSLPLDQCPLQNLSPLILP